VSDFIIQLVIGGVLAVSALVAFYGVVLDGDSVPLPQVAVAFIVGAIVAAILRKRGHV
jgi:hypothetical protein